MESFLLIFVLTYQKWLLHESHSNKRYYTQYTHMQSTIWYYGNQFRIPKPCPKRDKILKIKVCQTKKADKVLD